MVSVKVDFNGDMRRMSFKDRPTLPELRGLLNSAYMADMAQYVLTYQDFEGDQIVVLSDRDLREAFEYALTQPGELLRMSLALKGASQPTQPAPPAQPAQPAQPARPATAPARPSAEERQRLMQEEREARRAHRRAEHAARIDARREHFRQKQKERESAPAQDASSLLNLVLSGAWPLIAPYWQQLCEAAQHVFSLVMQNDGLRRFVRRVLSPALHNVLTLPFVQCILRQLGVDVADHSDKPGPCSSSSSCGPAREAPAAGRCCGARFMPTHPVPVHMAICDGCEERIVGVRFKCAHCPDFDLCENCIALREPLGHPASHEFRRVEAFSGQCPRRRGCPRPGFGVFVAPQEEGVKAPVMPTTFVSPANPSPKEEAKVEKAKVEEVKVEEVKVTVEDEREEEEDKEEEVKEEEVKVETFEEKVRKVAHNDDEARKLVTLGSMGFDDLNVTVNVLRRNRGNLMATVNDLIRF